MTDSRTQFDFGSNTQAHKMALILQALAELEKERDDFKASWNQRRTELEHALFTLKNEVLSGQKDLLPSPEPAPDPPKEAA